MKPSILKHKSIIAIALTLFMVVPMLFAAVPVKATGNATLSLVPSTNINLTYPNTLPSTFTVQCNIAGGVSVWGVNVGISWNPAVLHETACVKGTYLSSVDSDGSPAAVVDNTAGTLTFSDVLLSTLSANGAGTLFTVTFSSVGFGSGSISINSVQLRDPTTSHANEAIDTVLPYSITLNNPLPPPKAPVAAYTIAVASPATLNGQYINIPSTASSATITLDATSSQGGFDGSVTVPINSYSWTIHSVSGKFADLHPTGVTATIMNIAPDDITVSLTVSATETSPPPAYTVNTNTIGPDTYHVLQAIASGIDVYTQNGGTGPGANSGPFGPQQNVVAFALVTSNGAPVASKNVEFYVVNAKGQTFASLSAETNEQGIATVSFRLPTIDTGVEQGFGTWNIQGIVDISQVMYVDNCHFTFNYLVNISPMVTVTPNPVVRGTGTVTITATITNTTNIQQGLQVTFTVVDSNNVPIVAGIASPAPSSGTTAVAMGLVIPNYAFTGQATIYINALTSTGMPYCPQNGEVVTFNGSGAETSAVQNPATQVTITY